LTRIAMVAGRPHSGTTWLARILAEICDGSTPVGGGKKTASSNWRIERTHGEPQDRPYEIAIFTKRDPRDILVSLCNRHPHRPPQKVAEDLCGAWPEMLDRWRVVGPIETSYETLRPDGVAEVMRLAREVFDREIDEGCALACLNAYRPKRDPRPVGAWKQDLSPDLARFIENTIGDRIKDEGYAVGS
jgi:hypothetical protein